MIETLYVNSRGQLTLPARMRKALRLKDGSPVVITKLKNKIEIYPIMAEHANVLSLYGSIKVTKGKSADPEIAINEAKKLRAIENVT